MNKIPVVRTISAAYGFTFGHVGTVIGLIWLPLLISYVGRFFVTNYAAGIAASGDPSAAGRAALVLIGFFFLSVFFVAIIGISVTRQALQPKTGNIVVNLSVGQAEFNYFLSLLAIVAVMFAVYVVIVFAAVIVGGIAGGVVSAVGSAAGSSSKELLLGVIGAVTVLALAALFYIGVRLAFLVAPVTVSEGKIDLIRAWQLGGGNFWRMFAILLLTVGPVLLVSEAAFVAIVGPDYIVKLVTLFQSLGQAVVSGAAPQGVVLQKLPDISAKTPMILGLGFLLAPFTYGMMFSAPAFAYGALTGARPPAPSPDVGPFRAA